MPKRALKQHRMFANFSFGVFVTFFVPKCTFRARARLSLGPERYFARFKVAPCGAWWPRTTGTPGGQQIYALMWSLRAPYNMDPGREVNKYSHLCGARGPLTTRTPGDQQIYAIMWPRGPRTTGIPGPILRPFRGTKKRGQTAFRYPFLKPLSELN